MKVRHSNVWCEYVSGVCVLPALKDIVIKIASLSQPVPVLSAYMYISRTMGLRRLLGLEHLPVAQRYTTI